MFTMDRCAGKLIEGFSHVEKIKIHLGLFGGGLAEFK
jgi:hypothetical protein